jgi:hypothetical protein
LLVDLEKKSENSMSAVFGDSALNSLPGKIQPRPSIDEFNLRKGIKPIQRHKTVFTFPVFSTWLFFLGLLCIAG